jgi:hypothetical protein
MPGVLSGKITEGLRQRFAAEAQSVGKELTDPATGELFFRTPAGKAVLAQIQARFDEGFDVTPAEHVRHMAMAEAMPIYREVAAKQAAAIVELQQRLARYEKAEPAQGGGRRREGQGREGLRWRVCSGGRDGPRMARILRMAQIWERGGLRAAVGGQGSAVSREFPSQLDRVKYHIPN